MLNSTTLPSRRLPEPFLWPRMAFLEGPFLGPVQLPKKGKNQENLDNLDFPRLKIGYAIPEFPTTSSMGVGHSGDSSSVQSRWDSCGEVLHGRQSGEETLR
jgi:hypothetical protein